MNVYYAGRLIVVESNIAWALPYWRKRKQLDDRITWRFK
tara:strand:+ start:1369 stop:1485 length:117 start_codon:yes stop_codon:yes gene_type:complete